MQNQNEKDFPLPRAAFSKFTLVQFNKTTFFLLDQEEFQNAGIKEIPNLPNFAPQKHKNLLNGINENQVRDRQVQTYSNRNLEVFIFTLDGHGEERFWLSKSAYAGAMKDASGQAFKNDASTLSYNEWKAQGGESHQDKEGDTVMSVDDRPIKSVEEQNSNSTLSFPTRAREPNQPNQPISDAKRIPENRPQFWTREDLIGHSGETPEPSDDGQVIYGLNCTFGKAALRGLVFRDDAHEFERLSYCPPELIIPDQKGGMAPKVDNLFIQEMEKSDRVKFDIKGCAAKWHGKPDKQVLVILKIKDPELWKKLKDRREDKGYGYNGPLVCSLSKYRDIFGEDDIPELEEYLRMTQFAIGATEEEISLKKGGNKQPKADTSLQELSKQVEFLTKSVDSLSLMVRGTCRRG